MIRTFKKGNCETTITIEKRKPKWWEHFIWIGAIVSLIWFIFF